MATITQRGDRYYISVHVGYDVNHKRIRETMSYLPTAKTPAKIKKEVEQVAAKFEDQVLNGKYLSGAKITFVEVCEMWKERYAAERLTLNVQEEYWRILERNVLPSIGTMAMSTIKPVHLSAIYSAMRKRGNKVTTIKRTHAVISGIMTFAYKNKIIEENICRFVDLPVETAVEEEKMHCFTPEQGMRFLQALSLPFVVEYKPRTRSDRDGNILNVEGYTSEHYLPYMQQVFFHVALLSGCRRGELCALTWEDVNEEYNTIHICKALSRTSKGQIVKRPKTKAGFRTIALPAECITMLRKWKRQEQELMFSLGEDWKGYRGSDFDRNFIFIQQDSGVAMNMDTAYHSMKKVIQNYNSQCDPGEELPDIRFHDLRHTTASLLIANNTDIMTVSKRLGHSNKAVTLNIYAHAIEEKDNKAADLLGDLFMKNA